MSWQPWPGHPCFDHGCDGCAVCRRGRCCAADSGVDCAHPTVSTPAFDEERELRAAIKAEAAIPRPTLTAVVHVEALTQGVQPVTSDLIDQVKAVAQNQLNKGWTP